MFPFVLILCEGYIKFKFFLFHSDRSKVGFNMQQGCTDSSDLQPAKTNWSELLITESPSQNRCLQSALSQLTHCNSPLNIWWEPRLVVRVKRRDITGGAKLLACSHIKWLMFIIPDMSGRLDSHQTILNYQSNFNGQKYDRSTLLCPSSAFYNSVGSDPIQCL